jgi:FAD/FMN-containing dehydrogenase/ferredoxin
MKARKAELFRYLTCHSLVYDDPTSLKIYGFDQGEVPPVLRKTLLPNSEPDLAVQPSTIDDLAGCIRYGLEKQVPIVPRGAATFGMGGAVPHQGGISLDFSTRREIYSFDVEHQLIRVGAGCRWADISQYLQPKGFDLCTYPTSWFSTVGGWASTGGCGIGCTKYGSFHSLIESIRVVTARGEEKELHCDDPEFDHFIGTEGQMGAIWDITFQVRRKPITQIPFVILFDNADSALECAQELLANFQPYHLKFLDAARIHEMNHLLREEHPTLAAGKEFTEKATLLVCFEDSKDAGAFRLWAQKKALFVLSDYKAHWMWRERMFPLRIKRIAPGLLASELILPLNKVAPYAKKAARLGDQFGVQLATECYFLNDGTALTLPVYTFRGQNAVDEALKSSLAFVLTQAGIRLGGRPYGIGIWNSPFLKHKFGSRLSDLRYYKISNDPQGIFNPGKFFNLKFRTGIAGKLMALPLNASLIPLWTSINPVLASVMTSKNGHGKRPSDLILENEELCSKCGSCISICPAYIDTQDERTTARGKLQLGKWILQGGPISKEEANVLFLCMHCGACTDVCQSRLDLVPVWDELERRVETQFGKDVARVEGFFKSVESKKIMGVPYARGAQVLDGSESK